MNGNIICCIPETRTFLTKESTANGIATATLCDLDGKPFQDDGLKYPGDHPGLTEVYIDAFTAEHFVRVPAHKVADLNIKGVTLYTGVGAVAGQFVVAPDFTVNGRHGGRVPVKKDDKNSKAA